MSSLLRNIETLNQPLYDYGTPVLSELDGGECYAFEGKQSSFLVTAPHSVWHWVERVGPYREGLCVKLPDGMTGGLVRMLHQEMGAYVLYLCRFPEYREMHWWRDAVLSSGAKFVLDIHGMKDQPFDIAIGTGFSDIEEYPLELEILKNCAEKYGLTAIVNYPDYTGKRGITGFIQHDLFRLRGL
ncbi:MAG: hypothetical protein OXR68_02005 [Alphaproteobacteria bacterium]|nr:hypothetical protein [Alphaproteobacteria bacterium]MDD9919384.1 hypothetical protein [Alphaproteobacteria bacterium]